MGAVCTNGKPAAAAAAMRPQSGPPKHAPAPFDQGAAWLRIIHVTDVYTLEHFPRLKTLIAAKRAEAAAAGARTLSVLTGDFLAPYLLASFDMGQGMVRMLNGAPIDYVTWGNQ